MECDKSPLSFDTKKKQDIAPCQAKIPKESMEQYIHLYKKKKNKTDCLARKRSLVTRSIENNNELAAVSLESYKKRGKHFNSGCSLTSTIKSSKNNSPTTYSTPTDKKQELVQMKIYGGPVAESTSKLTMAIADFIHSCGLPFRIADHPKFRMVVQLSKFAGATYKFPGRNQVATELLDCNYETYMKSTNESLLKDINIFGLSFYGDGATVRRMPLLNIMASGGYVHTAVLEIVDCTSHMEKGGKKDARYIASIFRPHIDFFETTNPNCVDYCTFDGAANVQKAGEVLSAYYPRIICTHGAEHVISLFFQDCFKSKVLHYFVKLSRKLYAVFGSGSQHAPYAIFQKYSRNSNNNRNIGLLRAAQTRMGGEAIALQRLLRLKEPLQQTVESNEFIRLKVIVFRKYLFSFSNC